MQSRNFLQYVILTLKGMGMGVAELVPGVSGGTIAFVAGIYEEFISSLSNVNLKTLGVLKKEGFQPFWNRLNGNFLLALLIGMAISILSLSKLIKWLLEFHPIPIWSFFFGLVLASIIFVAKAIKKWNMLSIAALVLCAGVAYYITTLPPSANTDSLPFLFMSGAIAICAMLLPGLSGAFILVLLGSYETVLEAVNERDFKIVITVALGCIVGLLSFSKVLKWLFTNYKDITLAALTGFIIGSLNKIWPWKEIIDSRTVGEKVILTTESITPFAVEGDNRLLLAAVMALVGFLLILMLEKFASKEQ